MGWHDDEDQWLPAWTVAPMLWLGCLLTPIMPTLVVVAIWGHVATRAPASIAFAVYGALAVLLLFLLRPWTAQ
jgi:hypothetical protein